MMNEVRIGVLGAGRIGRLHMTNLVRHVDGAKIAAVADPIIADASGWLSDLGVNERYEDYHELLGRDDVDAVFICASTGLHAQMVIDAAGAGKQIFCEKPIDLDIDRAREALSAVDSAGVQMQLGFNRRFDHNFAALRKSVKGGEVGDVHIVKVTARDPKISPVDYLEQSGGMFLDMSIHDFDIAEFVSGASVEKVYAAGAVLVSPEIKKFGDIDTALVTLWFSNGALGLIDNSRQAVYGYDQRVEVFGSEGMVMAENDRPDSVRHFNAATESRSNPLWFFLERFNQAFVDEARAFVSAIQTATPVPVSGEAGLRAMLIALAANKSLAENRAVLVSEVDL